MKSIGEIFKQQRSDKNISLKEAENATSIRISYLSAIEEGDIGKLISPVYAQGFVKQYASFLGLDGDKIVRDFPELFRPLENQEFSYGIGTLEMRGHPAAGVKWFPNAFWALACVLLLVLAWYAAHALDLI